jgi:hypothetical protein
MTAARTLKPSRSSAMAAVVLFLGIPTADCEAEPFSKLNGNRMENKLKPPSPPTALPTFSF